MCEVSTGQQLLSLTDLHLQEQPSLTMPALTVSNNLCKRQRYCISLGPGPRWCS